MVHLYGGFSIDGIGVPSQLIDLSIDLFPDFPKEVFSSSSGVSRYLFSDIEVISTGPALKLTEDNQFVWLSDHKSLITFFDSLLSTSSS